MGHKIISHQPPQAGAVYLQHATKSLTEETRRIFASQDFLLTEISPPSANLSMLNEKGHFVNILKAHNTMYKT